MATAASSSSGGWRKRRRNSGASRDAAPAPAAAAAAQPACVAAAVEAVQTVKQKRAERAAKRRRKDTDRSAKRKRQQQAVRDHRDMVKVVIGAAAEGYSRGAVHAAFRAAADEFGVKLPLQRPAAAAEAAGAADCTGLSDSNGDSDGVSVSDESDGSDGGDAGDDEEDSDAKTDAQALRERVRQLSPFAGGRVWTADMKNLLVLAAYQHLHARLKLAAATGRALKPSAGAATAAALFFGANRSRVAKVLNEYAPDGLAVDTPHVPFTDTATATRKPRSDVTELSPAQVDAVSALLRQRATKGATTTWVQVHQHLVQHHGVTATQKVVRQHLEEQGFGCIGVRSAPVVDLNSDYWQRQRERYVIEYAAAREEELKGEAVIVFVDQSFVNLRHRRHQTIADLKDHSYVAQPHRSGPKAVLRTGLGRGQLLIISHAITRDGLLARLNADGQLDRPRFAADPNAVSAELIYESGKENDDYHAHFDNATFLAWVKRQLFPAFTAKYGNKKMILMLDNSGNQSAKRTDYVKPTARKQELHDVLVQNGITELTVQRKLDHGKSSRRAVTSTFVMLPRVLTEDQWMYRHPDGASVEELTAAVRDLYSAKPQLTWSELEVIVNAGVRAHAIAARFCCSNRTCACSCGCVGPCVAHAQGPPPSAGVVDDRKTSFHRVVWTVAYHSESNPIEKQWAIAKNYVASQHTGDRSMAALLQQLLTGLYGDDEKNHVGVTAASCTAAADHSERELQRWMLQSERIKALFPGRATERWVTIAALNARRRALYGPLVRPHRRGSKRNDADDVEEGRDDDGYGDVALPPPAAAAPAPAAASASSSARK